MTDIPGRNEPDPQNIRQRSFQGGGDGIPDAGPELIPEKYRQITPNVGSNTPGVTHSPADREGGARVRVREDR
ncbi:MAG: hypothetical protein ACOY93_21780 [Bacillota bacterium]